MTGEDELRHSYLLDDAQRTTKGGTMKGRLIRLVALPLIVLAGSLLAQGNKGKSWGKADAYSISVTALKGQSATEVCINVLTNDVANYPLPNNFKKLQLKIRNHNGDVVYVKNMFDVPIDDGTACVSVTDLFPTMPVNVQAHIKTERTVDEEVVKATTQVLLRPDLVVTRVDAPSKSIPNSPFNIVAVVQEKNGQSGATANVGLWEGETLLSNAADISVQPGGEVSVLFQGVSFAEAGTHELKIKITDAVPGEYDTANNEFPFSILIENSVKVIFYELEYELYKNYRRSTIYSYCGFGYTETTTGGSGSWTYNTSFLLPTQAPIDSIKCESVSSNGTLSTFAVYGLMPYASTQNADHYYQLLEDADGSYQYVGVDVNKASQSVALVTYRFASDEVYVISYSDGSMEHHETHSKKMNLEGFLEVRLLFADDGKQAGGAGRVNVAPFTPFSEAYYEAYNDGYCDFVSADSLSYDYSSNSAEGTTDPNVLPTDQSTINLQTLAANMVLKNDLVQNYPNPFNPSTNIQFTVDRSGPTVLMIYDMLGREVAELFHGHADKGRVYQFAFQASSVSSGMYYARLYTSGRQYMRKMLLMK
jgi:hypothetical protein